MIQHDFIVFEPEKSAGVLNINDDHINTGVVQGFGPGFYTEHGVFLKNADVVVGDKIFFTNHIQVDKNGTKVYLTRGRDVIEIMKNEKQS